MPQIKIFYANKKPHVAEIGAWCSEIELSELVSQPSEVEFIQQQRNEKPIITVDIISALLFDDLRSYDRCVSLLKEDMSYVLNRLGKNYHIFVEPRVIKDLVNSLQEDTTIQNALLVEEHFVTTA